MSRKIEKLVWDFCESLGFDLEEDNAVSEGADDLIEKLTDLMNQSK